MKRKTYKWHVATALLVCSILFIIQNCVFQILENRGARFVSPIFQDITMIRLQRLHTLQGKAIILGSSITERLMASPVTAVLGVPGSSFTAGLKLLSRESSLPTDTTYILEVNNMFNGINHAVLKDASTWDFLFFRDSHHFSIAAKPTNLLLSCIYHLKSPEYALTKIPQPNSSVLQPANMEHAELPTPEELVQWKEVLDGIADIKRQGGRICFVHFPSREAHMFDSSYTKACKLARYLQVPILNYNTEEWRNKLVFTDSHHLDSKHSSTGVFRETIARDAKACAQ